MFSEKIGDLNIFKNTQNCFAYISVTKYPSEAVLYSKRTSWRWRTLLAQGFWNLVIPQWGHKVPGINLRSLKCCLTLKLRICFQKYELTSHDKKVGLNLKKKPLRFWDLKVLWIWDFATTWITKMAITRSIFEIEISSLELFLIFMRLSLSGWNGFVFINERLRQDLPFNIGMFTKK